MLMLSRPVFETLRTVACQKVSGAIIGIGCHSLLQKIFPTQGLNPISCVSYIGRWALYHCMTLQTLTHELSEVVFSSYLQGETET